MSVSEPTTLSPIAERAQAPAEVRLPSADHGLTWRPLSVADVPDLTSLLGRIEEADAEPFRTSPELATAVIGKQVDLLFETVPAVLGMIKSGQLKAIAVTGDERFEALPDVATVKESGALPGYVVATWYGLVAPRGTPPALLATLNKALTDTLATKDVQEKLAKAGAVAQASSADAFGKHITAEVARWEKVREAANIEKK